MGETINNRLELPQKISNIKGLTALSPIAVFMICYLLVSIVVGDFYSMPLVVAMLIAAIWGVAIYRKGGSLNSRIETFSREAAKPGIIYMVWVFVLAGAFSSVAKYIGAVDATVNLTLSVIPGQFVIPGIFVASCLISMSIGTSVGTVVALAPLAMEIATMDPSGKIPLYVAAVVGGAFFGDNLSFISDTTIAATRSQGTDMRAKFKANIFLALPAAVITMVLYILISNPESNYTATSTSNLLMVVPYLTIIILALAGVNVITVLICGIATACLIGVYNGMSILDITSSMGTGIDSMGNLIVVTLLAAGMLGITKAMGGIQYLLQLLTSSIRGVRGAQSALIALVGIVNLCTANNTVAIITVGPLAKEISQRYKISPQRSASLLDTGSCIVQCIIPYGAQILMAASLTGISPVSIIPYLYYPVILAIVVAISIIFKKNG